MYIKIECQTRACTNEATKEVDLNRHDNDPDDDCNFVKLCDDCIQEHHDGEYDWTIHTNKDEPPLKKFVPGLGYNY